MLERAPKLQSQIRVYVDSSIESSLELSQKKSGWYWKLSMVFYIHHDLGKPLFDCRARRKLSYVELSAIWEVHWKSFIDTPIASLLNWVKVKMIFGTFGRQYWRWRARLGLESLRKWGVESSSSVIVDKFITWEKKPFDDCSFYCNSQTRH